MAKVELKDRYQAVELKSRKQIIIDNLIGGIAWGLGTVIGATFIVGILGIIIVNTKKIPLVGDLVKVVTEQVQNGLDKVKSKE